VGAELGPERVGEDELGVGGLPEEEVGDAVLAAGADDEVHRRQRVGPQLRGEDVLGEGTIGERAGARGGHQPAGGCDDLLLTAVGQRQGEHHRPVVLRLVSKRLERIAHHPREPVQLTHRVEPDLVLEDLLPFLLQIVAEKVHQSGHLLHRPGPVLGGERVERERLDADAARGAGDLADAVAPLPVTLQPGQAALLRPAPVAVHDDAHVPGQGPLLHLGLQGGERRNRGHGSGAP
jgi:hypothetical protein